MGFNTKASTSKNSQPTSLAEEKLCFFENGLLSDGGHPSLHWGFSRMIQFWYLVASRKEHANAQKLMSFSRKPI